MGFLAYEEHLQDMEVLFMKHDMVYEACVQMGVLPDFTFSKRRKCGILKGS